MKNNALTLLLVVCLAGSVAGAGSTITPAHAVYGLADVQAELERSFHHLTIEGCTFLADEGEPDMPVRILRFVIPPDMEVEGVTLSQLVEQEVPGTFNVVPSQPRTPTGVDPEWVEPDGDIYGSDDLYPAQRVVYLGDGYLAGHRIASVALYPLQYAPKSGRLSLATDASVELALVPSVDRSVPRERRSGGADEHYARLVASLVENPGDVAQRSGVPQDDGSMEGGFLPRYTPSLEGSGVDYVVVTSDEFEPLFQGFADWKTKQGVPAVVRTLSWVDANYPDGVDAAERIRMFIKDAYSSWGTSYVLLGGDTNIVPTRFASSLYSGGELIPCELYFSSLEGDWNGDGDHLFGEGFGGIDTPGDSCDLYPDVFVGRAPVADLVEAETFVSKCQSYVETPEVHFTDRNLFLAEVLFPYDWESGPFSLDGATDIIEPIVDLFHPDLQLAKLYANHGDFPDSYPLNSSVSMDSLDTGYNIAVHVGHGNKDIIRVSNNNYISMSDMSSLSNGLAKSSFLWLLDCSTAAIDFDCIAERAINNPAGGAVGAFGATRLEFPGTSKDYFWEWIDLLYTYDVTRAGETCALAKAAFASPAISGGENSHRWTQLTMMLLGDPELPLWTGRAGNLSVGHPATVLVGETAVAVSVTDGGPVEGALVCALKDGEVYERVVTGADGIAWLDLKPDTVGEITVSATAQNYIPSESSITVMPSPEGHLYLSSHLVDDDSWELSRGNGNGKAEAGETVELSVEMINGGGTMVSGVSVALTTADPQVVIDDGMEAVGSLMPGSTAVLPLAFSFTVSDTCHEEHDVTFTLEMTDGSGTVWTDDLVVRLHRPELVQFIITVDDSAGNGNGVPEVGEKVDILVEVANDGTGDADAVSGTLSYPAGAVTIDEPDDVWGDIPGGVFIPGSTGFSYTVNAAPTYRLRFDLSDAYGKVWTSYLDFDRPSSPDTLWGRVKSTTIALSWVPSVDADVRGYMVYRSLNPGGPFDRITTGLIETASLFSDSGLAENTLYYYYVTAVDSSGNVSLPTDVLPISTNPPSQSGWPLATYGGIYSSPALADIDGDGNPEIVITSDHVYVWRSDGTELMDGDGDPRTGGIFEMDGTGGYRCSAAVGDIDDDLNAEIVAAAWADVGATDAGIYEIYAWNAEDGSVLAGWPVVTPKFCWASPALADLDNDGRSEVVIACADGNLYCWRSDGSEFIDGDGVPSTDGVFADLGASYCYGSTAVADLDGDGIPELIQPSTSDSIYVFRADGSRYPGWPFGVAANAMCSPAVGDVDNDGALEILVGSHASRFWLLESDGTVMDGWPVDLPTGSDFPPSPVLADLTGDGFLEAVLVGKYGRIIVADYLGDALPGWPVEMGSDTWSSPAVADIDDDPDMEIVVGTNSGKVYAFDANGSLLAGWPIQTDAEVFGSPAVGDLDGDGDNEVIVGGMDTNVYVWDSAGANADGEGVEWGSFLHDAWRTQLYEFTVETGVAGDDGEDFAAGKIALEQNSPNPFNPVTTIAFTVPEGDGSDAHVTLSVYAVDGSVVRHLLDGRVGRGRQSVVWDGRDADGRRVASGVYFYRLNWADSSETRSMVLMK